MRNTKIVSFIIFLSLNFQVLANFCQEIKLPRNDSYTFTDKIYIKAKDGVRLGANIFEPRTDNPNKKFPAVLFANSWFLEEHEYFNQAKILAEEGFIVLSYSARGWGCSEGLVNVIGENDMSDLSTVIDWLRDNSQVDMNNIGMSGISYGGGMTLKGLALEPRIKTGVAMSTWSSLVDSLYGNDTFRTFWSAFLMSTGYVSGELDPFLWKLLYDFVIDKDMSQLIEWAEKRSPINFIDKINERRAPVFIANNFGDNLFQPNPIIKYYEKLKGPKRLELNQGTHTTGEGIGLFLDSNYTFNNARAWFKYWLKGEGNIDYSKSEISLLTSLDHKRETYSNTNILTQDSNNEVFHLQPRTILRRGKLNRINQIDDNTTDFLMAGVDTLASTGVPLASALINGHLRAPVIHYSPLLNTSYSLVYQTEPLSKKTKIRGIPELSINVTPDTGSFQLVTYLYDINPYGISRLITHGVMTKERIISNINSREELKLNFELLATAYNIKKGHRLGLVFDTADPLYFPLRTIFEDLTFNFGKNKVNTLKIRTLKN